MSFWPTRYSATLVPPSPSSSTFSPAVRGGFGEADNEAGRKAAALILTRMEAGLGDGPWLMGERYTLADIDLIPFVDRFAEFYQDMLNEKTSPKTCAWLMRMRERPAVKAVWATDEAPAKAA